MFNSIANVLFVVACIPFFIFSIQGLKNVPYENSHDAIVIEFLIFLLLSSFCPEKFYFGPGFQQNWPDLYNFTHNSFNIGFRAYFYFPH